jgi:hypothetical protein
MHDYDPALALHVTRMGTGSDRLLHAIRVARGEVNHTREKKCFAVGDDLMWTYDYAGAPRVIHGRYAAEAAEWMQRSVTKHETKRAFADTLRVSRDPCPMCGVRGDVGCKHKRLAA